MSDKFFVGYNLTGFTDNGTQKPISRVTFMVDDEHVITSGDDTGIELLAECPHATQSMADSILANVRGTTYRMFTAEKTRLDPSAELGDGITAENVYSVISRIQDDGGGFPGVTAPGEDELEDEYPTGSGPMAQAFDRKIAETRSEITKTAEQIRLEVTNELNAQSSSLTLQINNLSAQFEDRYNNLSSQFEAGLGGLSFRIEEVYNQGHEDLANYAETVTSSISNLQSQIDGQIETFYYDYEPTLTNAPASAWRTEAERAKHEGDLFYWKSKGYAYRFFKDGSTWKWQLVQDTDITAAMAKAAEAQDTADGKRRVFVSTPKPPYDVGDLWAQGANGDLLRCQVARSSGSYVASDWIKASKYTDDSALTAFITGDFAQTIKDVETQLDGKVETWYQTTDPSTAWTTTAIKNEHKGDLWFNSTTGISKRWDGSKWVEMDINPPQEVFDQIDGKAQIFIRTPTVPYYEGDLWFNSTTSDIMTCIKDRTTGSYTASDWQKRNKYTDDTTAKDAIERTAKLEVSLEGITSSVSEIRKSITEVNGKITETENTLRSEIKQTADSISLSVSGSLGGSASITMTVGDRTDKEELDLSGVRQAFANDKSAITISAGTITFNSGTFVLNSGNISIDKNGNLTSENGTITGAKISGGSVTTESGGKKIITRNGNSSYYHNDVFVGSSGTNVINNTSNRGIVFDLAATGEYLAWAAKTSNDDELYILKMLYANKDIYSDKGYLYKGNALTIECATYFNYRTYFDAASYLQRNVYIGNSNSNIIYMGENADNYRGYIYTYGSVGDQTMDIVGREWLYIQAGRVMITQTSTFSIGSATLVADSDVRLKTNIEEADVDALSIINGINLYSFDWIESGKHVDLGFISQQLEAEASADFVQHDETEDVYRVKEFAFVPYLVKAVQQLYNMVAPKSEPAPARVQRKRWNPDEYTEAEKKAYVKRLEKLRPKPPEPDEGDSEPREPVYLD